MYTKILNRVVFAGVVCASILLSACGTDHFARVKTTDGYLSETKITLPERVSEDIGRIVFIRKDALSKNIPMIFINERAVGSLPPERYSETLVCPGEQSIRIDTRTGLEKRGAAQSFVVKPGSTSYLQIAEGDGEDFAMRSLSEEEMQSLNKGLSESHLINRHQPICDAPLKVLQQINLGADALFKFDTAQMLPAGQAKVQKLVHDIQSLGAQIQQIRVTGYTDRLGSDAYNQRLSLERAQAVSRYMKRLGLQVPVVIAGRGKQNPVVTCSGNQSTTQLIKCLQPNRRVTIELMGVVEKVENKGMSSK